VREQLYRILFKPDKNGPEYKAVVEATRRAQRSPLDLLAAAGAISSPYQFHWRRFLFEFFAKGTGFPALAAPPVEGDLPLADGVAAFSIDDSATTEIDDALSVRGLGSGTVVFGIHIAAPGLAIAPDSALDKVARERMSTVYMPGWKITMLPDEVVQAYTLMAGRDCPAVSLYATLDEATLELRGHETKIERVPIVANLRHLMAGEEPEAMQPWYRGFQGSIVEVPTKTSGRSYQCSGIISQVRRACCRSCWAALASLPWVAAQGHDHSCSGSHTLH
jgi:exoribonuclease-2